jgi:hypothetical protein
VARLPFGEFTFRTAPLFDVDVGAWAGQSIFVALETNRFLLCGEFLLTKDEPYVCRAAGDHHPLDFFFFFS